MNRFICMYFLSPSILSGCLAFDDSLDTIQVVSGRSKASLVSKHGGGSYFRYRGNIGTLSDPVEDINSLIMTKVGQMIESDTRLTEACGILDEEPHHFENGYYTVDILCR